jgi:hypothetical protein
MKGPELVAHIRSLTSTLDKEEMKEFLDLAEETVFKKERCLDVYLSFAMYLLCRHVYYAKFNINE